MAGEWIKMRTDLATSPKVVRIASALKADGRPDKLRVVGALHAVWCLFDAHSEDGTLVGYSPDVVDDLIGWPGFCETLVSVGWAEFDGETLALPRFDDHNGKSAKRRAMDADRKRTVRNTSASDADKKRTREEESREEGKAIAQQAAQGGDSSGRKPAAREKQAAKTADRFEEFWQLYPVKKGKADAERRWRAQGCDKMADDILAHVAMMQEHDDAWRKGVIPYGSTYVNGKRWTDVPVKEKDLVHVTTPAPPPESFGPAAVAKRSNTESPLERALAHIRHQHALGAYGEGDAAAVERDRLIGEATNKHRVQ